MRKYKKSDSVPKAVGRALAYEGKGIAKGVVNGLLSLATLGLFRPKSGKRGRGAAAKMMTIGFDPTVWRFAQLVAILSSSQELRAY